MHPSRGSFAVLLLNRKGDPDHTQWMTRSVICCFERKPNHVRRGWPLGEQNQRFLPHGVVLSPRGNSGAVPAFGPENGLSLLAVRKDQDQDWDPKAGTGSDQFPRAKRQTLVAALRGRRPSISWGPWPLKQALELFRYATRRLGAIITITGQKDNIYGFPRKESTRG